MKKSLLYCGIALSMFFSACDMFEASGGKVAPITQREIPIKTFSFAKSEPVVVNLDKSDIEYFKILDDYDGKYFSKKEKMIFFNKAIEHPLKDIYLVKLYVVDKKENDFYLLLKIKVGQSENAFIKDSDNDYIPDNIEKLLNMDKDNPDQNNNGIKDGLENDPFFEKEWYIYSQGIVMNPSQVAPIKGNDLHLLPVYSKYMGYNKGNPIIIQIVDSGIESTHEDLAPNFDMIHSLDGASQGDPIPGGVFRGHGTMLAGIAAARAFNGKGVRGVAPFAQIAGSNWLAKQSLDGLEAAWYSGNDANAIAVSNNSWGRYFTVDTIYEDILEAATSELRDGKGRVFVFASGNARSLHADSNIQYMINNRFGIVVGALDYTNKVASYSTPGANIWISAYGGSKSVDTGPTIATTYLSGESKKTWEEDEKKNYTYAMAGSSAAAPMVSGAIALILEACPNLTYRDVKYVLAKSAIYVDKENPSWVENGSGLHFSRDYGFGLINTKGAIDFCQNNYHNLPPQTSTQNSLEDINATITDKKSIAIEIEKNMKVEWVEATVDINSTNASNLDIYLTSPAGTKVKLVQSGTKVGEGFIPVANWMDGGFRFSTGAMLDEESSGSWEIEVVKTDSETNATLKSVALKIYGYERGK